MSRSVVHSSVTLFVILNVVYNVTILLYYVTML